MLRVFALLANSKMNAGRNSLHSETQGGKHTKLMFTGSWAGQRLSANYKNGQFELFFYGVGTTVSFNSAKEALEYVGEVEKQLGDD